MALAAVVPGRIAPKHLLVDVNHLTKSYYDYRGPLKNVEFGTSGHRGSSLNGSFNDIHIAAITQAICEYRAAKNITGPLFIGYDTHALSLPAFKTAIEVLTANGIEVVVENPQNITPTPVISHRILDYNRGRIDGLADGIIITPSHNGPQDGGFKYNPPHAGPADVDVTKFIQDRANGLIASANNGVLRDTNDNAQAKLTSRGSFMGSYVLELGSVVDMEAIADSRIRIGVDPMGGAGLHYWGPIARAYGLDITVVNDKIDPTFSFMPLDWDGTIRMDCSSPDAMANLIGLKDKFDIGIGNDTDYDRHGIVCPTGLMNPNHFLSVAIWYLLGHRPNWRTDLKIGKTLVSSTMIDRVVKGAGRQLYEVPVGFKWFVPGLSDGSVGFGGEESAGASFLRMDGTTWVTEKDGIIMGLLAAEILAVTGKTPAQIYSDILVPKYGDPFYKRVDGPITVVQKAILKALNPSSITAETVAGLRIVDRLINAPGNGASIGGVKIVLEDGSWFAIRPSGTEPKMKVYIESFGGEALWRKIHAEAPGVVFGNVA